MDFFYVYQHGGDDITYKQGVIYTCKLGFESIQSRLDTLHEIY